MCPTSSSILARGSFGRSIFIRAQKPSESGLRTETERSPYSHARRESWNCESSTRIQNIPPSSSSSRRRLGTFTSPQWCSPAGSHSCPWDPWDPRDAQRERSQVKWLGIILYCIHGLRVLLALTHSSILGYFVTAVSGMCSAVGGLING